MGLKRKHIRVHGVVQGVGFRPFVYRTAIDLGLHGHVRNCGDAGVEIVVEGTERAIGNFLTTLRADAPPLARVDEIEVRACEPKGDTEFSILPSTEEGAGGGSLPPDIAICDACVAEVLGESRFRDYWATSCTDCGPRFTVIESLPYDRPRTSMCAFPMCDACAREYRDPRDRRYHAQTTACPACGPTLRFDGETDRAIERTIEALRRGRVVAIKGIGGTHLACDATDEGTVMRLRERLGRPSRPFAIMGSGEILERFAEINEGEWCQLKGPQRPIVVLRTRPVAPMAAIAPGLHTVGAMLPYSGLHHLLFARLDRPLVMTSANLPGRPMLIEDAEIRTCLAGIADHWLLHDRRIVTRCDDSVRRRVGGTFVFLRRSRGYVPCPIAVPFDAVPILALGPETDVTFTLCTNREAVVSQYIGSTDDLETLAFLDDAIEHLYGITTAPAPEVIGCDLHPHFATTHLAHQMAEARGVRVVQVQHHVAHLCAVMAEHDLRESVGILLDGYGHGWDGTAWGGEVLVAQHGVVERAGSLHPVRLPGGDLAARNPLRMVAAFFHAAGLPEEEVRHDLLARGVPEDEFEVWWAQIEQGINAPWTTSAGRFLDAVAAWLGLCRERTYEGEPAMRLEATAAAGRPYPVEVGIRQGVDRLLLDTVQLFAELVRLGETVSRVDIAATAQVALAVGIARMASEIATARGIRSISFSGGVAYNDAMASVIRQTVEAANLDYFTNEQVPCGDGGVSFGQAAYVGFGFRGLKANRPDTTTTSGDPHHREQ